MPDTAFDLEILLFLNQYARSSESMDALIGFISGNHLIKGGVPMALFWWAWFREEEHSIVRARLLSTLVACLMAIIVARLLAHALPFRLRPIQNEDLPLVLPFGVFRGRILDGWSSFPSDHAVLFYALATGLFCASRKPGLILLVYTTLLIALPRIYLGLHYPSDILAGAVLGMALTLSLQQSLTLRMVGLPLQKWSNRRPALFYALFFLLSYQIADMFNSARSMLKLAAYLVMQQP